jgi:hypothetical protein
MRAETIKRELFTFDELSDEGKEKAIENLRYINIEDHEWWDYVYSDAEDIGLKITEFDIDRGSYAHGNFTLSAEEVAANIIRDHGETCETYKTAENFLAEHNPVYADYMNEESENYESPESEDKLQEMESEFLKSLLEDYRIMLSKEYDYLTSEEAIRETIEANEYEFTEDGNMA